YTILDSRWTKITLDFEDEGQPVDKDRLRPPKPDAPQPGLEFEDDEEQAFEEFFSGAEEQSADGTDSDDEPSLVEALDGTMEEVPLLQPSTSGESLSTDSDQPFWHAMGIADGPEEDLPPRANITDPIAAIESDVLSKALEDHPVPTLEEELKRVDFTREYDQNAFLLALPQALEGHSSETGQPMHPNILNMIREQYALIINHLLEYSKAQFELSSKQPDLPDKSKQPFSLAMEFLEGARRSRLHMSNFDSLREKIVGQAVDYAQQSFDSDQHLLAEYFLLKVRGISTPEELRENHATDIADGVVQEQLDRANQDVDRDFATAVTLTYNAQRFATSFGVKVPRRTWKIREAAYRVGLKKMTGLIEQAIADYRFEQAGILINVVSNTFPTLLTGFNMHTYSHSLFADVLGVRRMKKLYRQVRKGLALNLAITNEPDSPSENFFYMESDWTAVQETLDQLKIPIDSLWSAIDPLAEGKLAFVKGLPAEDVYSSATELEEIEAFQPRLTTLDSIREFDRVQGIRAQIQVVSYLKEKGFEGLAAAFAKNVLGRIGSEPMDEEFKLERAAVSLDVLGTKSVAHGKHLDDLLDEKQIAKKNLQDSIWEQRQTSGELDPEVRGYQVDIMGIHAAARRPDQALIMSYHVGPGLQDSARFHYFHGYALLQIGAVNQAITAFQESLEINGLSTTYYALACAFAQKGDIIRAKESVTESMRMTPGQEAALDLWENLSREKVAENYMRIAELRRAYRLGELRAHVVAPLIDQRSLAFLRSNSDLLSDLPLHINEQIAEHGRIDTQRLTDFILDQYPLAKKDPEYKNQIESSAIELARSYEEFTKRAGLRCDSNLEELDHQVRLQKVRWTIRGSVFGFVRTITSSDHEEISTSVAAYALSLCDNGVDSESDLFYNK
ncbi:hypothetical protein ACFLZ6_02335, partial [Nanoarchaeota archaeon]